MSREKSSSWYCLSFGGTRTRKPPSSLTIEDLDAQAISELPDHMETGRGPHQAGDHRLQGEKQQLVAGFEGLEAQGDGQVGLSDAGRPQQDDAFRLVHKAQRGQLTDHFAIDAGQSL